MLFGSSEDGRTDSPGRVWTIARTASTHGALFVGRQDPYAQGGINDVGLCFDAASIPGPPVQIPERPRSALCEFDFCQAALAACATIDDLEPFLRSTSLDRLSRGQFLFADATGASLVLGIAADGDVLFDRTEGPYRVITNFNIAAPSLGHYPCWRYDLVTAELRAISAGRIHLTYEVFLGTLEAVHLESGLGETAYSCFYDLVEGSATLFYRHDFSSPVTLDIRALTMTEWSASMDELFGK